MRPKIDTPALLTHVSKPPSSRAAVRATRSTSAGTPTSAGTALAVPPAAPISAASASSAAALRAVSTSRAPRAAAIRAVTSPMPLDAPVMTTT
jgi:hypothetical protein